MDISNSKKFDKAFKKLSKKQKLQALEAIEVFKKNPFDKKLRNHALKGKYLGYRSLSAANDLRIIYTEENGHLIIIMIDVGTHNQVY